MKVTYEKKEIDAKEGATVKEALKEEIEKSKYEVIGCRYNNEYFNLNKKIEELLSTRYEKYRNVSDILIDINGKNIDEVISQILVYI